MKALFFDMDGTLLNSETLHEQAWFDTLAQFELSLSKDWFHQWTGSTDYHLLEGIQNQFGCLLYTSPSPRDATLSRMPSSA